MRFASAPGVEQFREVGRKRLEGTEGTPAHQVDGRSCLSNQTLDRAGPREHDPELAAPGQLICLYGGEADISVRPDAAVEVLCTRTSLEDLERFDPEHEYDSGEPTVTIHRYGKGRAIYIAADAGGAYLNNPYPPLKRFIAKLVKRTRPPVEIEAIEATAAMRETGVAHHLSHSSQSVFRLSNL